VNPFEIVREQIDILEVAQHYTDLRSSGRAHVGRCPHPDHEDKNPSFYVYPDRRFHCYGCGWYGDVTDLWAVVSGGESGIGAALDLTRRFGIEIADADPEAQRLVEELRQRETEYLKQAEKAHRALAQTPEVTEWWEQRGFAEDLRRRFILGACDGAAIIPFWNRGRVHGLIRRKPEGEPKYLLPRAEDLLLGHRPLFVPGSVSDGMFLVEGYRDALALVALGYDAAAVGGTHPSSEQVQELMRLPGRICILPDADQEGARAARRWAEELFPKALVCPSNYDKEVQKDDD
jgi:DNA primase